MVLFISSLVYLSKLFCIFEILLIQKNKQMSEVKLVIPIMIKQKKTKTKKVNRFESITINIKT